MAILAMLNSFEASAIIQHMQIIQNSKLIYLLSKKMYTSRPIKRFRLLMYASAIIKLNNFFNSINLTQYLQTNQDVIEKISRTYIFSNTTMQERIKLIQDHYLIALEKFNIKLIQELLNKRSVTLVNFQTESSLFSIVLAYEGRFKREGAWTIGLYKNNDLIYTLAFSFILIDSKPAIIIGCIQGMDNKQFTNAKDIIRDTTKELYGLRPADLMLFIMFEIGSIIGINLLFTVKLTSHAYMGMIHKKATVSLPDYDIFWLERGALSYNDKMFILQKPVLKDISEVDSKKRSMYKKRYAMLGKFQTDIISFFNCHLLSDAMR